LAQGLGLEIFPFGLQVIGACPEHVYRQAAEGAQRRRHDRHVRRHALRRRGENYEVEFPTLPLDAGCQPARGGDRHGADGGGNPGDGTISSHALFLSNT
jgi:hypothetical protein